MKVEVTLAYRDDVIVFLESHETLYAAEFLWTLGSRACDCERCERLAEIGYEIDDALPCNESWEDQQIKLVSIRPYILH